MLSDKVAKWGSCTNILSTFGDEDANANANSTQVILEVSYQIRTWPFFCYRCVTGKHIKYHIGLAIVSNYPLALTTHTARRQHLA